MTEFMGGSRGGLQQVGQFEITGVAAQAIDKGDVAHNIFFHPKKVQLRVIVIPDHFRIYIGHVQALDIEVQRIALPADGYGSSGRIPVCGNVGSDLGRQLRTGGITIDINRSPEQ